MCGPLRSPLTVFPRQTHMLPRNQCYGSLSSFNREAGNHPRERNFKRNYGRKVGGNWRPNSRSGIIHVISKRTPCYGVHTWYKDCYMWGNVQQPTLEHLYNDRPSCRSHKHDKAHDVFVTFAAKPPKSIATKWPQKKSFPCRANKAEIRKQCCRGWWPIE